MSERVGHNAIYEGSSLMVFGGRKTPDSALQTERCVITNGQALCTSQSPELYEYSYFPELFLVPVNFCKTFS